MIAYAEEEDGDGDPRNGANGAQYLHDRVDDPVGFRIPAQGEAERYAQKRRNSESDCNAPQRVEDVVPQNVFLQQLGEPFFHFERRGNDFCRCPDHGKVPDSKKQREGNDRPNEFFPPARNVERLHIL